MLGSSLAILLINAPRIASLASILMTVELPVAVLCARLVLLASIAAMNHHKSRARVESRRSISRKFAPRPPSFGTFFWGQRRGRERGRKKGTGLSGCGGGNIK